MNETLQNYRAAIEAARAARDECETIAVYLEQLARDIEASPTAFETALPQYRNVIGDEMNHCMRFILNVVAPLTGIEPDMDGIAEEVE